MGNAKSAESMSGDASNVVPMRKKVKADTGTAKCLLDFCQRLPLTMK